MDGRRLLISCFEMGRLSWIICMVQCGHKDSCKWAQEAEERDPETAAGRISPCLKVVGVKNRGAAPYCPHISLARRGRTSTHKTVPHKGVGRPQGFMPATRQGGEWVPSNRLNSVFGTTGEKSSYGSKEFNGACFYYLEIASSP